MLEFMKRARAKGMEFVAIYFYMGKGVAFGAIYFYMGTVIPSRAPPQGNHRAGAPEP